MADPITLITLTAFIVKQAPSWYTSLRGTILGALPQLAQVGVGVLARVIATKRALILDVATGSVACRGQGGVVAGPDQAVLLVLTEVLGFVAADVALPRYARFGGATTQNVADGIIGDLVVEECRAIALPRCGAARWTQVRIIAEDAGRHRGTRTIGAASSA